MIIYTNIRHKRGVPTMYVTSQLLQRTSGRHWLLGKVYRDFSLNAALPFFQFRHLDQVIRIYVYFQILVSSLQKKCDSLSAPSSFFFRTRVHVPLSNTDYVANTRRTHRLWHTFCCRYALSNNPTRDAFSIATTASRVYSCRHRTTQRMNSLFSVHRVVSQRI